MIDVWIMFGALQDRGMVIRIQAGCEHIERSPNENMEAGRVDFPGGNQRWKRK